MPYTDPCNAVTHHLIVYHVSVVTRSADVNRNFDVPQCRFVNRPNNVTRIEFVNQTHFVTLIKNVRLSSPVTHVSVAHTKLFQTRTAYVSLKPQGVYHAKRSRIHWLG